MRLGRAELWFPVVRVIPELSARAFPDRLRKRVWQRVQGCLVDLECFKAGISDGHVQRDDRPRRPIAFGGHLRKQITQQCAAALSVGKVHEVVNPGGKVVRAENVPLNIVNVQRIHLADSFS